MSTPEDFVAETCPEAHLQEVCKDLRAENVRLRALAADAYAAWDTDHDARVGKLLRAMLDAGFSKQYRPDLVPNAAHKRQTKDE
jgi:hypothetical protein